MQKKVDLKVLDKLHLKKQGFFLKKRSESNEAEPNKRD